MVVASHVIFSLYGFWLPNDPRGSWSDFVGAWELLRFGRATTIFGGRSRAADGHNPAARRAAKAVLKHPPAVLTGLQARAVARGFARYAGLSGVVILACPILPEHVHLVVERHRLDAESVVNQLKGAATRQLKAEAIHPMAACGEEPPTCWARGQWIVFLNTPTDVRRAVDYVNDNPLKEGKVAQHWNFVSPV